MNEEPPEESSACTAAWIDQILDLLIATDPNYEEEFGELYPSEDTKPFITNSVRELVSASYPQARVEKGMKITAYSVGAMAGHKWDFTKNLGKNVYPSHLLPLPKNPKQQAVYALMKAFLKRTEENANKSRAETRRALAEAFFIALDQDSRDTREFLNGFTKGLNTGTLTKTGRLVGSKARTILHTIVVFIGPDLDTRFKSVNEFHAWVEKTQGSNIAGSLERFQKFCNSIQLHFKKPGRLKKEN